MDDRKLNKKLKRFAARLKDTKNLICIDSPTTNIILCNAGQATGLRKNEMYTFIYNILPNLPLPKFIPIIGESYSFLVFDEMAYAETFLNACNNVMKLTTDIPPIYMTYIQSVPISQYICVDEEPKGLKLFCDFITQNEQEKFLNEFDILDNNLKNRQVKHYGYEFRYTNNDVDLTSPMSVKLPELCKLLWKRLRTLNIKIEKDPDQLTVNKYMPGQGIPSHVDKHSPFEDTILSLSLGSPIVMDWKHHSGKYVPVYVPPKSLLLISGEARYDWQHGIQPRTWDPVIETKTHNVDGKQKPLKIVTCETVDRGIRISLTFRWTRSGPCECIYKTLCDSAVKSQTDDLENGLASTLEELHVHQVYEQIADHFSTTRHKPWPKVVEFMSKVETGSVVLDLGCGNGKNILKRNDILQIAGERSYGLVKECKNYTKHIPCADCIRLDLLNSTIRDCCADVIICIAVIHHFSNKSRRVQALQTIARLLTSGGRALITVWAKDQSSSSYLCKNKSTSQKSSDTCVTIGGINLPVHENRTQFLHSDLLVPWKLRKIKDKQLSNTPESTLFRYYHVFQEGELEELCRNIPSLVIKESFYEEGNWCIICQKV